MRQTVTATASAVSDTTMTTAMIAVGVDGCLILVGVGCVASVLANGPEYEKEIDNKMLNTTG